MSRHAWGYPFISTKRAKLAYDFFLLKSYTYLSLAIAAGEIPSRLWKFLLLHPVSFSPAPGVLRAEAAWNTGPGTLGLEHWAWNTGEDALDGRAAARKRPGREANGGFPPRSPLPNEVFTEAVSGEPVAAHWPGIVPRPRPAQGPVRKPIGFVRLPDRHP